MKTINKNTPNTNTNNNNAPEAEVLNTTVASGVIAHTPEAEVDAAQEQEQLPEAETQEAEAEAEQPQTQEQTPFTGASLEVKKQLININFAETREGTFKVVITHKTNPLSFPDIVIGKASLNQILTFAANGLNAVLNDNSGSRKPEKWAEIDSYLKYGFLTKSEYINSLPKSKPLKTDSHIWVDEIIILTINQTKELDVERKSKLISRLYSEDTATKDQAFSIAKAWIDAVATVKADYAHRLAEWRQEQEQAAINPLLDAIDTL